MKTQHMALHVPVLLKEVIHYLHVMPGGVYIDATLGDGGYSKAIVDQLTTGALISFDCDDIAIDYVSETYHDELLSHRWTLIHENFSHMVEEIAKLHIPAPDGIVFDLGLSSRQLDGDPHSRGFSYLRDQKLDMRMDTRLGVSADDLARALNTDELTRCFVEYGEERHAKRIAVEIKKWIVQNPDRYLTSDLLAALVRKVVPAGYREGSKHPARRVFQAFRVAVNDELHNLQQGLSSALSVVASGGRVIVISYHSLEDRIVKTLFFDAVERGSYRLVEQKPVRPSETEMNLNPRSASAKLRAIEKT